MLKLSHILLNAKKAERHPFEMLLVGFFYTPLSLFLALWIFPDYASIVMVFLTVLSSLYIVQGALIIEEDQEKNNTEKTLIKKHARTLLFLLFLFLGFLLAFMFWTIVLPGTTADVLFSLQESEVRGIKAITGNSTVGGTFTGILSNNFRVLLLSLVFAIFYGAGAIFILAWNASIMGFVMGALVKNQIGLIGLPLVFTKYFLHGIPEMLAYFIAALAGGIIFVTIIRGDFSKIRIKRTAIDTSVLILASLVILVIAAAIETFISPFI